MKFTVPKRTGLKRKRGSDEFSERTNGVNVIPRIKRPEELLRSLRDHADTYQIELMGHVEETHRFRGKQHGMNGF